MTHELGVILTYLKRIQIGSIELPIDLEIGKYIEIDEETKQKSLRIIKEQSEKLQRLIEDLLTIPDIERMRLKTVNEPTNLVDVLER